jgi:hypothetical protein
MNDSAVGLCFSLLYCLLANGTASLVGKLMPVTETIQPKYEISVII